MVKVLTLMIASTNFSLAVRTPLTIVSAQVMTHQKVHSQTFLISPLEKVRLMVIVVSIVQMVEGLDPMIEFSN